MRIAITGANGFIGSALARFFESNGHDVIRLQRQPAQAENSMAFDLTAPKFDTAAFVQMDVLIHTAYIKADQHKDAFKHNIEGSKMLLQQAQKDGVKQIIFLSSLSAHAQAESVYGKQKFQLAKNFRDAGATVVRPGLVLGNGGLFLAMKKQLQKSPRIPVFGNGQQPIQTVHVDDLILAIDKVIAQNMTGEFCVAEPVPVAYTEFYGALATHFQREAKWIKLPLGLLLFAVRTVEKLHLPFPISSETLLGLKYLHLIESETDLKKIGITLRNWKASIASL